MEDNFSKLVNLLWEECIRNLNEHLSESETVKFSNNDYYYLLVINSLQRPNFTQISESLSLTKPAVSAIIRKLSNMELVYKVQSKEDKRVFYVELSDKGKQILNGDREIYKWVTDSITDIAKDERELQIVGKVMQELVTRLERKRG
jgi:DNA-binding MarR family transcriptional regulator